MNPFNHLGCTRIQTEARLAAALNHPNIATVYELGEFDGGLYIAMEFLDGENLKTKMDRGPFEVTAALDVAIQTADALAAAHARSLLHCDIKSSNIVMTSTGLIKVLDFGLAKFAVKDISTSPAARWALRRLTSSPAASPTVSTLAAEGGFQSPF